MNIIDKESFLGHYKLNDYYDNAIIHWEIIEEIVKDYQGRKEELDGIRIQFLNLVSEKLKGTYHIVESRLKEPEHLAEKIIRKICIEGNQKYTDINRDNYLEIISDLIGVRVLVLAKEGWEEVHDKILEMIRDKNNKVFKIENNSPKAYIRYGDRDVFHDKIEKAYTCKGYRSQHYTVVFQERLCEIQVRTIAEEVFGEFDHKIRYPYRQNNNFLMRYTIVMGQITSVVDEMISTCLRMDERALEICDECFEKDEYIGADKRNQPEQVQLDLTGDISTEKTDSIGAIDRANNIILRRRGK